jgi:hypothetical protein
MKFFWLVFFAGLIPYYFFVAALKVELDSLEILAHTLYYFFSGFIVLAGWCFYKTKKHLKILLILIFCIFFLDDLSDYVRGVDSITTEMLIYNLYVLLWGSLSGAMFISFWRRRLPED